MGIEPTSRVQRLTGFEDQGKPPDVARANRYARRIQMLHQGNNVLSSRSNKVSVPIRTGQ